MLARVTGQSLKLHSYVVARDYGFAPNPFYGFCTLATCKPRIRDKADVGDWVVGTGSKAHGRDDRLVYAMHVTEAVSFDEFWNDPRFARKRPMLEGSKKQAFGDNIYHQNKKSGGWCQLDSHHSLPNGKANVRNVSHDTQVDRVLISDDFVYWGGRGPKIPARFRNFHGADLCAGRGHKNSFSQKMIDRFVAWLRARGEKGYCGAPFDWSSGA